MYLSNKYHTPLILSLLLLSGLVLNSQMVFESDAGAVEIVGFENRDGDSALRGITATPLSEELSGELSSPPVIRSEDVSHGSGEACRRGDVRRWRASRVEMNMLETER